MPATLIDPYRGETEHEMDMLGRYIAASESGLVHARDEDKRILDEQSAQIEGGFVEVTGAYLGHAFSFHEEFPMIMRYGHVTALYSFTEHRLRALCDEVSIRKKGLPVEVGDLKGFPYVEASKTFLTKVVDAKITQWGEVGTLAILRNCIVHCNGFIDDNNSTKKLEGIVNGTKGLKLSDQRRLLIERAYVEKAYQKICDLFTGTFGTLGFGSSFYMAGFPMDAGLIVDETRKSVEIVSSETPGANETPSPDGS